MATESISVSRVVPVARGGSIGVREGEPGISRGRACQGGFRPWRVVAVAALLLPPAAPGRAQAADAEVARLREDVERLQRTVAAQDAKIAALEGPKAPASAPPAAPDAASAAPGAHEPAAAWPGAVEARGNPPRTSGGPGGKPFVVDRNGRSPSQKLAPRHDNVPIEPEPRGYVAIPGTEALVRLGGSVTTVLTVSSKYFSPTWMVTSAIPVAGQPYAASRAQVAAAANESDVAFEFRVPSPLGTVRFVYDNDFAQPAPGFVYHLNYFYVQGGNLLLGFCDSAFTDVDANPTTLDYQGANAVTFSRHAMASYALSLHRHETRHLLLKASVESPGSQVSAGALVPRNVAPDVGVQLRLEGTAGHVQLATILRAIGVQGATGDAQTVFGWGLNVTGGLNLPGGDFLSAGVAGGQGAAAYFNDTGGLGLDAALDAGGTLVALPILGAFAGFTHVWAPRWRSTAAFGWLAVDDAGCQASLGAAGFRQSRYASLNLEFRPWAKLLTGIEGLYGLRESVGGAAGDAWRGQVTAQYAF